MSCEFITDEEPCTVQHKMFVRPAAQLRLQPILDFNGLGPPATQSERERESEREKERQRERDRLRFTPQGFHSRLEGQPFASHCQLIKFIDFTCDSGICLAMKNYNLSFLTELLFMSFVLSTANVLLGAARHNVYKYCL